MCCHWKEELHSYVDGKMEKKAFCIITNDFHSIIEQKDASWKGCLHSWRQLSWIYFVAIVGK